GGGGVSDSGRIGLIVIPPKPTRKWSRCDGAGLTLVNVWPKRKWLRVAPKKSEETVPALLLASIEYVLVPESHSAISPIRQVASISPETSRTNTLPPPW